MAKKPGKKREKDRLNGHDAMDPAVEVWAAGGVVQDKKGRILVAHRPRYDDWTLPKGKLDPGETLAECALREVEEETGYVCNLGDPVASVQYHDAKGRLKEVRYWAMTVLDGSFEENDEVDAIEWKKAAAAHDRLSYTREQAVLEAFFEGAE